MATYNQFDFSASRNPELSARIASLLGTNIGKLITKYTGRSVTNISATYPKPPKAYAAIDLMNKTKADQIESLLHDVTQYERDARAYNSNQQSGKPITNYTHMVGATYAAQETAQTETIKIETIETIVNDNAATQEKITLRIDDNTGNPLVDAIRAEINNALDALDISAGTNKDEVNALIKTALKAHGKPNIITIEHKDTDNATTETIELGLQHHAFAELLEYCKRRKNVWLPGPAGSGKTTAAEKVALALGLPFYIMGAIQDKTEVFGYMFGDKYVETAFYQAWKNAGVILWDEADGSDPNAAVSLNAAFAGTIAAFPCGMIPRHKDCIIIAAANTFGHGADSKYVGRYAMDKATLDRFQKIVWDYDPALEQMIIGNDEWYRITLAFRAAVAKAGCDVLVTTRAGQRAVTAEEIGLHNKQEIIELVYRDGLSDDQWRQVKSFANI